MNVIAQILTSIDITEVVVALIGVLTLVACLSQNLIPVHIAYIPILVPPLLRMMNRMRLDRRAVACALAFGHKAPYITIPFGFGLIFQRVIADNLSENGLSVTVKDVTAANWSIGVAMLIGLFIAVFVLYRKPRDYHDIEADTSAAEVISEKLEYRHYVMLAAAIVVAVVQVISQDLALSALCGLIIIIVFRAIKWSDIDEQIEGGIRLMGQIAIIMLVAGGYASVIKATGGIDALVNAGISAVGGSKVVADCHYTHRPAGDDGHRHLVRHCARARCAVRADVQLAWVLHSGYHPAHFGRRCPWRCRLARVRYYARPNLRSQRRRSARSYPRYLHPNVYRV